MPALSARRGAARCAWIVGRGASLAALCAALGASASADTLDEALSVAPVDALAAVVVRDLKRASDDLTVCLDRIDRPEAMLVGRPIDLFKAHTGLAVGLRDNGAMVGALRPCADAAPAFVLLAPVDDADAFLRGNFRRDDARPGMAIAADGRAFHTRVVARGAEAGGAGSGKDRAWVALSESAEALEGLRVDPAAAARHRERLGKRCEPWLATSDVLAWADGLLLRGDGPQRIDLVVATCDIDALGLLGKGLLRLLPEERGEGADAGPSIDGKPAAGGVRLDRLPGVPYLVAFGADAEGLQLLRSLGALLASAADGGEGGKRLNALGLDAVFPAVASVLGEGALAALRAVDGVQLCVYPSKLGVAVGGVLNDSALVLECADPEAMRKALRQGFLASEGRRGGLDRKPTWESDRAVKDSGTADAFELAETTTATGEAAGRLSVYGMLRSVLFGGRGLHGLLKTTPGAVVVTFSQRPDVWRRALAAAQAGHAGARDQADTLGSDPIITAMRAFLVEDADAEAFIDLTRLGKLARQVAALFPGSDDRMPSLDFGDEPVGVAVVGDAQEIEGAIVVPSGVIGVAIDLAKRRLGQ